MATTDLSDAEIVLGKLFSRLAPILGLLACALPVVALAALLGGIDGRALVTLFAISAAVAVLGCALAISVSVEVAKTHEVIMAVMALIICWLMSLVIWQGLARAYGLPGPPDWFYSTNPFVLVYAPYSWPGRYGLLDVTLFVIAALAISAGLTAWTIARLRRFVLPVEVGPPRAEGSVDRPEVADATKGNRAVRGWLERLPGPSLDGNPVLWREWHRNRPSRMARSSGASTGWARSPGLRSGSHDAIAYGMDTITGGFVLQTTLLLQSVPRPDAPERPAPTSLGEERVRGSLDVVMTTPMSTRSIVWGKWLGTYRIVLWLAILPGLAAAVLAFTYPDMPQRFAGFCVTRRGRGSSACRSLAGPRAGRRRMALLRRGDHQPGPVPGDLDRPGPAAPSASTSPCFVLLSAGWPFLYAAYIMPVLRDWLSVHYATNGGWHGSGSSGGYSPSAPWPRPS